MITLAIAWAIWALRKAFSAKRRPTLPLLILAVLVTGQPASAASNVIFGLTVTGPNITSVSCTSTAYVTCYKLTLSSIDAFALTSSSGLRTIVNPNASNPTSALWISDANITFQVGNSINGQLAAIGVSRVTNGFSHSYLTPEYCVSGCTSNTAFSTFSAANTVIYNNVSEGPTGGSLISYPISVAALMNAGNGANFAGFGTPGVQGDTFQFDIHVLSVQGNKTGDALVTVDVQQAASAIISNVSYNNAYGTVVGLPFSSTQPVTAVPFPGTVNYNQSYTYSPQFTQFSNTTGTLAAYLSTDFSPALAASTLRLCDAATNSTAASCTPISKSAATPTTVGTALTSGSGFSHYLGLMVAEGTGYPGNSTSGSTNATLTLTFSVP